MMQAVNSHYSSLVTVKSFIPLSHFFLETHPLEGATLQTAHISGKAHFFRGLMARVNNMATSSKAVLFIQSTHLESCVEKKKK